MFYAYFLTQFMIIVDETLNNFVPRKLYDAAHGIQKHGERPRFSTFWGLRFMSFLTRL